MTPSQEMHGRVGVCEIARLATMHPLHEVCMEQQKKQNIESLSYGGQLF